MATPIAQIIISLVLIGVVILQAKGAVMTAVFGGSNNYHAKSGVEKTLFYGTIFLSVVFVALAIANAI